MRVVRVDRRICGIQQEQDLCAIVRGNPSPVNSKSTGIAQRPGLHVLTWLLMDVFLTACWTLWIGSLSDQLRFSLSIRPQMEPADLGRFRWRRRYAFPTVVQIQHLIYDSLGHYLLRLTIISLSALSHMFFLSVNPLVQTCSPCKRMCMWIGRIAR